MSMLHVLCEGDPACQHEAVNAHACVRQYWVATMRCTCTDCTLLLRDFTCDGPSNLPKMSVCPTTLLVAQQKDTPLPL